MHFSTLLVGHSRSLERLRCPFLENNIPTIISRRHISRSSIRPVDREVGTVVRCRLGGLLLARRHLDPRRAQAISHPPRQSRRIRAGGVQVHGQRERRTEGGAGQYGAYCAGTCWVVGLSAWLVVGLLAFRLTFLNSTLTFPGRLLRECAGLGVPEERGTERRLQEGLHFRSIA